MSSLVWGKDLTQNPPPPPKSRGSSRIASVIAENSKVSMTIPAARRAWAAVTPDLSAAKERTWAHFEA